MRNRDLRPAAKANPTIQQAFERFQKYNRLKNLSQGSLDFYAAKGRSFFRFLGDTEQPIHTITEETVEDYIFYMKDQQLHDTTINTNLRMVRAFLYWCMEKGYLEKYPIRLVRADDPIKEPYTTDELQKLLKEPDCKTCSFAEYRNWVIVNFLLGTGCRASTLLNLQIGDLDLSAGTVFITPKNVWKENLKKSRSISWNRSRHIENGLMIGRHGRHTCISLKQWKY